MLTVCRLLIPCFVIFANAGPVASGAPAPRASESPNVHATGIYNFNDQTWNSSEDKSFSIVIITYYSWSPGEGIIDQIKSLASDGHRVIVNFQFLTPDQRRGLAKPASIEQIVGKATVMLDALSGVRLEGVSIDEENVLDPDRKELIARLYSRLKWRFKKRKFLQWLSAASYRRPSLAKEVKEIPADGWIIDPYNVSIADYQTYLDKFTVLSDNVYSVLWASPNWNPSTTKEQAEKNGKWADKGWWNEREWKRFYNRVSVNQATNVPSIFFLYARGQGAPVELSEGNKCDKRFYKEFIKSTVPHLRFRSVPLDAPKSKPRWIPTYCGDPS